MLLSRLKHHVHDSVIGLTLRRFGDAALAAPFTVNTMPELTLKAFADHGTVDEILPARTSEVLAEFAQAGIDADALAAQLQQEGAESFVKSWKELMECIVSKSKALKAA